jgi:hypothetical protein
VCGDGADKREFARLRAEVERLRDAEQALEATTEQKWSGDLDPPLDPGIERAVLVLREAGVETYESCEGGEGHAYAEPTVRFHGERAEGFRALAAAMQAGLAVAELRRVWSMQEEEPNGPSWELVFTAPRSAREAEDG